MNNTGFIHMFHSSAFLIIFVSKAMAAELIILLKTVDVISLGGLYFANRAFENLQAGNF